MAAIVHQVEAQTRQVSGRVTDRSTGEGLPGATVLVKGTTNGVSTNSDGTFTLTVPAAGAVLQVSSVGYLSLDRPVGEETQLNIGLSSDTKQLSEVVVTALGIERDTRSLGYATQEIKAEQISQKSEPNVLNALQGKVAGVNITGASGLAGSSTNINIRGITSLQNGNQPLFVVDGIPISNDLDRTNGGSLGTLGGAQTSNRALDIDPESIASINILKGPAAAALYGSRASSGAIIITTKTGRSANKKTEVTVTSSLNVSNVYGIAKLQDEYGQGTQGVNITTGGLGNVNTGSRASWGPRYGTTPTLANGLLLTDGSTLPYRAYDNIRDFYRQGRIFTNGVNVAGGNADQNVAFNVTNTDQTGIVESSELNRTNAQLGGNIKLVNKLRVGGSVNFIQTNQKGPLIGNGGSAFGQLGTIPRSYDLQGLPSQDPVTGANIFFAGQDNPYFNLRNNPTTSNLTRFINVANVSYEFRPWLNVAYRAGYDTYTDRRRQVFAIGSARVPGGLILDENFYRSELNGDLLVTLKKDNIFTEGFNASLLLGQNINQRRFQRIRSQAEAIIPGLPNAAAGTVFSNGTGENSSVRRLMGYYSQLSLAYNNYLFLELTGRVDESSTLPVNNNTFFYPAATLGFVFSDAFKISNNIFSYGKIRANVASVGRDADPYSLATYYNVTSQGNNVASITFPFTLVSGPSAVIYPGFSISNTIGGSNLTPEFTKSFEVGTNLGFFNNRLTFDLTYFSTRSEDQILPVTTASSSGFTQRFTNIGRVDNKGFEALVVITPVRTNNFRWDVNANFTRIRNKVVSIAPGVTTASINGNAFTGSIPSFRVGEPYGVIIGGKVPRVPATDPTTGNANDPSVVGRYIINPATGLFDTNLVANEILADPNPDWQGGITNSFSYRGISLSFLVDANVGSEILSFTNAQLKANGAMKETAENREAPRLIPGVIRNADGTYRENNIQIDAQNYYSAIGGLQSEFNVYDATVYRLRELSVGYSLPKSLLERTPFGQASITLTGRNVFFYAPNAPFDPEINTQGAGNIRGLELQSPPNTRNYGVNLRFTF
ncbi:SusC/RagA family TonB-linked outer membrane protein [Hymenobacter jeollabukensis]